MADNNKTANDGKIYQDSEALQCMVDAIIKDLIF